jgi:hypothetical protein
MYALRGQGMELLGRDIFSLNLEFWLKAQVHKVPDPWKITSHKIYQLSDICLGSSRQKRQEISSEQADGGNLVFYSLFCRPSTASGLGADRV